MRAPTGDRSFDRERELTAYAVVGDLDAARRIAAEPAADPDLVELMLRECVRPRATRARSQDPTVAAVLPPREIALWWWLRGLPVHDRVALVMAGRHGWAYDDRVAVLLDQASVVLGRQVHQAPAAVGAALERRFHALAPDPARGPDPSIRRRSRRAAGAAAGVLLLAAAATALAGASPPAVPAEPPPARLLPRPLARPIVNYEGLAVVPGRQWDLPERGGRRSAPPWTR